MHKVVLPLLAQPQPGSFACAHPANPSTMPSVGVGVTESMPFAARFGLPESDPAITAPYVLRMRNLLKVGGLGAMPNPAAMVDLAERINILVGSQRKSHPVHESEAGSVDPNLRVAILAEVPVPQLARLIQRPAESVHRVRWWRRRKLRAQTQADGYSRAHNVKSTSSTRERI